MLLYDVPNVPQRCIIDDLIIIVSYLVPMNTGLLNAGANNDKYNKIRVAKTNFLL